METRISRDLFERALEVIPGGVNSPVRAFRAVGMTPPFIKRAKGACVYDVDGNKYIDYICSWGPMILGHAREEIIEEITIAAQEGTSFGAPTEREVVLAEMICEAVPSVEKVRMVSSGTEAVMSAIRLARGFTGRDKILKFEGCYHGHSDGLLVKAGSGALTFGEPDSSGVPKDYAKNTLTATYNKIDQVEGIFKACGEEIAAVIIEPVVGNMGVVPPQEGFLKGLRELTAQYGALLIFDEVITGFRLGYSGAQGYFNITPDLSVFGKIIGGGMPVGAYGGSKRIMDLISPVGPVYQAGTLSGNPVAMAAGIATLRVLKNNPKIYDSLNAKAKQLENAFIEAAGEYDIPLVVNCVGSLLNPFFTNKKVVDFESASSSDAVVFNQYFKYMLEDGIYLAPSRYEAMFVSEAHSEEDIGETIKAIKSNLKRIKAKMKGS